MKAFQILFLFGAVLVTLAQSEQKLVDEQSVELVDKSELQNTVLQDLNRAESLTTESANTQDANQVETGGSTTTTQTKDTIKSEISSSISPEEDTSNDQPKIESSSSQENDNGNGQQNEDQNGEAEQQGEKNQDQDKPQPEQEKVEEPKEQANESSIQDVQKEEVKTEVTPLEPETVEESVTQQIESARAAQQDENSQVKEETAPSEEPKPKTVEEEPEQKQEEQKEPDQSVSDKTEPESSEKPQTKPVKTEEESSTPLILKPQVEVSEPAQQGQEQKNEKQGNEEQTKEEVESTILRPQVGNQSLPTSVSDTKTTIESESKILKPTFISVAVNSSEVVQSSNQEEAQEAIGSIPLNVTEQLKDTQQSLFATNTMQQVPQLDEQVMETSSIWKWMGIGLCASLILWWFFKPEVCKKEKTSYFIARSKCYKSV